MSLCDSVCRVSIRVTGSCRLS
ncbi:hypothetical protein CP061683_0406A, partial [Chlamydia psittaci 06-1683]